MMTRRLRPRKGRTSHRRHTAALPNAVDERHSSCTCRRYTRLALATAKRQGHLLGGRARPKRPHLFQHGCRRRSLRALAGGCLERRPAAAAAAAAAANHSNESWNDLQTFIGVDRDTGRLLYTQSAADVADAGGQLRVPREVLQHVRALSVRRDLRDLHVYFLKRWVLDWLQHHPQLGSIRSELVPYLVRHQFAIGRRAAAAWEEAQQVPGDDEQRGADVEPVADGAGELESPATYRRRRRQRPEAPLLPPVPPYAAYSRALFPGGPMAPDDRIRCYAYSALPPHAPSLLRVNTMEAYVQANRQVASGVLMPSLQRHLHPYNMNEYDQGTGAATDRAAAAAETDSAAARLGAGAGQHHPRARMSSARRHHHRQAYRHRRPLQAHRLHRDGPRENRRPLCAAALRDRKPRGGAGAVRLAPLPDRAARPGGCAHHRQRGGVQSVRGESGGYGACIPGRVAGVGEAGRRPPSGKRPPAGDVGGYGGERIADEDVRVVDGEVHVAGERRIRSGARRREFGEVVGGAAAGAFSDDPAAQATQGAQRLGAVIVHDEPVDGLQVDVAPGDGTHLTQRRALFGGGSTDGRCVMRVRECGGRRDAEHPFGQGGGRPSAGAVGSIATAAETRHPSARNTASGRRVDPDAAVPGRAVQSVVATGSASVHTLCRNATAAMGYRLT
eukprot:ctg_393.g206